MRELESILARVARRRSLFAMSLAALIGVAAAGVACAAMELLWWALATDPAHQGYLIFWLPFGGLALAAAACFVPEILSMLGVRLIPTPVGVGLQLSGVVWTIVFGLGFWTLAGWNVSQWALPAILLPAGAVIGIAFSLMGEIIASLRGRRLGGAAAFLDEHFALKERAATAMELIRSGKSDQPWAKCVCGEALAAIERARPFAEPIRWPRQSAAMAGLSVLLCLALLTLPGASRPAADDAARRVADALAVLTPDQKQQLADLLRKAAAEAAGKPAVEANFQRAAQAAEQSDPEAMHKALEMLASGGVELRRVIPKELVVPRPQARPSDGEHVASGNTVSSSGPSTSKAPPSADYVRVMNPEYDVAADGNVAAAKASPTLPWADAWQLARARAMAASNSSQVPPGRRQLVRDFFE